MTFPENYQEARTIRTNVTVEDEVYCWFEEIEAHSWCPQKDANEGVSTGKFGQGKLYYLYRKVSLGDPRFPTWHTDPE